MKIILIIILGIIGFVAIITVLPDSSTPVEYLQSVMIEDTQIKINQFTENTFSKESPKIITYSVNVVPHVSELAIPKDALNLALSTWEKNNETIRFVEISKSGDIEISWKKIASPNHTGLASCYENSDGSVYGCELEISLGSNDCTGSFIQSDKGMITTTIMHEIGHAFGLDHHPSETHLMYGSDVFSSSQFDDRDYVIPKQVEGFYLGEKKIWDDYDDLILQINSYQPNIDRLQREYDSLDRQYSPYEGQTLDEFEYQKATSLYDELESTRLELNRMVETSNQIVYQSNDLLNTLDCFPGIDAKN